MVYENIKPRDKAGVIPFYRQPNGETLMMFRTPSDPNYGGSKPQVAKGGVDRGEDVKAAAIREGSEELGLKVSNVTRVVPLPAQTISGLDDTYRLHMYGVEVRDMKDFGPHDYETSAVMWMTLEQFMKSGRANQQTLVQHLVALVSGK